MKLLVFAHTPPPHHGQSYMVQLLLEALGGDVRRSGTNTDSADQRINIQCYHLNSRYSKDAEDIGRARWGKVFLAVRYSLRAIWWRFRYGVKTLYYIPAFPQRAPVYRDWIVLGLCRPFFKKVVFHWHAVGLGEWLKTQARPWEQWLSQRVYRHPDLSIVLLPFNQEDAQAVASKRMAVVPNGIPDPCPQFEKEVLPRRLARAAIRKQLWSDKTPKLEDPQTSDARIFRVLFLSLCYSGKGLFDTVEAVALARSRLKSSPFSLKLTVAGKFWVNEEQRRFEERIQHLDLLDSEPLVEYRGFVTGEEKTRLLVESDCLCFPTHYAAESFGLVLVEGMAYGLPLISTHWRSIPEILPPGYPGIVEPKAPEQIATKLIQMLATDYSPGLRNHFLENYTLEKFATRMEAVLLDL